MQVNEGFPLLDLHGGQWTVEDALQGTHIFGATGSGKTTGSGQALALNLLDSGMGGLVLTVKPDETKLWQNYCRNTNREIIVFGPRITPETPYSFNFLEYERQCVEKSVHSRYPGEDPKQLEATVSALLTENLVNLFTSIMEVAQRGANSGGKNDAYWQGAVKQLLRNSLDLLIISGQKLTFHAIYRIITGSPNSPHEATELLKNLGTTSGPFATALHALFNLPDNHPRKADANLVLEYWLDEFPALSAEPRSIIVSSFTMVADPFLRGTLRQLFSSDHDTIQLEPELIRAGYVVVLNLPVKEFFELGQFAQVLYKFIFQRAMERTAATDSGLRPVFLWADEAQFFLSSHDMLFQTTARSAKVATVYLTQNLSTYYGIMPGEQGKAQTNSLLGNFVTKIFHTNSDSVTNNWASDLIAKTVVERRNIQSSENSSPATPRTGKGSVAANILLGSKNRNSTGFTVSQTEVIDYQIQPIEFTKLPSGGRRNGLSVEAIFVQGGRTTPEGKNFQVLRFKQSRIAEQ